MRPSRASASNPSDTNGYVLAASSLDGFSVVANNQNFSYNTPRSIATWKRALRRLQELGYLSQLNDQVYEPASEVFERADIEANNSTKNTSALDVAGRPLTKPPGGSLLGPLNQRPNAILDAQYDNLGTPGPWLHAIIRQWQINGEAEYSLETNRGDEFMGTKDDVISVFFDFNRKLIRDGYKRMNLGPGPAPEFKFL